MTARDHELIISLPDSYHDSLDKEYPVLYFLDAYWHTPLLHSINGLLRFDNVIPEMIMVGLSYPGEDVNYDSLRILDLIPSKSTSHNVDEESPFLTFIEKSVIPFVESTYRADKATRALGGSSAGGLFTLFTMYKKPGLFNRYIAISPGVIWEHNSLLKIDKDYSSEFKSLPGRLFLSAGGEEYPPFRDAILTLQNQVDHHKYQGLSLLKLVIEGERHSGVCAEGYVRGLRWIFKDMAPTGPSGLTRIFE
ncbi:MAG: alpha/beta hydrolase-fold protein [Bacteroidota bacterium]